MDEASLPANEAGPFGAYVLTKLPLVVVFICLLFLFFHAQTGKITSLSCPFSACSFNIVNDPFKVIYLVEELYEQNKLT